MQGIKFAFGWLVVFASVGCSEQKHARETLGKEQSMLFISEQAKLVSLDPWNGDLLGSSVSLFDNRALVGSPGDDRNGPVDEGAAYVFERSGDQWHQAAKFMASDEAPFDRFGNAVALWEDTALVAASTRDNGSNPDQGAVYVFVDDGPRWFERQKLLAAGGVSGEAFGRSIAFELDTAVIGANGSARVFERPGATFVEVQKISPPAGANAATFGRTVALSGDTLLVGSSSDTVGANAEQGAAYVYERSGTSFVLSQTLAAADGQDLDHFGSALAIAGDNVVIGVDSTKPSTGGFGAAYVFVRSGGTFSQTAKLAASDATAQDFFGRAVAAFGDFLAIGAPLHEHGGINANHGSAYVFRGADSTWTQVQEVLANDHNNGDLFASAISLDIGFALVGSPFDDVPFSANGSAYVFQFINFVGEPCTIAAECQSGFCSDGVCCTSACSGACDACTIAKGAEIDGFCRPVPEGSPGEPVCEIACNGVISECPTGTPCSTDDQCSPSEYCHSGATCVPRKTLGSACSNNAGTDCLEAGCRVCAGGACIDGACSVGACVANVHCDANPCEHGSVCTDTPTGHMCACPPGVNGMDCEVVFTQLSGGQYDMCGLRSDGKIACWGLQNTDVPITAPPGTFKWLSLTQQLCAVRTDSSALCQGFGAAAPPPGSFKSIYAGDRRACGILADDTATCWGDSPLGANNVPAGTFRTLGLGEGHTCGVHTDGTVECWGLESPPPDYDVGQADPPPGTFTALTASRFETCGITGGDIVCWGTSSGLADLPSIFPWSMLGAGFSYGCALTDGFLVCTAATSFPGQRPTGLNPVIGRYKTFAIAGAGFACGVRFDDAVICWGNETVTAPPTGNL